MLVGRREREREKSWVAEFLFQIVTHLIQLRTGISSLKHAAVVDGTARTARDGAPRNYKRARQQCPRGCVCERERQRALYTATCPGETGEMMGGTLFLRSAGRDRRDVQSRANKNMMLCNTRVPPHPGSSAAHSVG